MTVLYILNLKRLGNKIISRKRPKYYGEKEKKRKNRKTKFRTLVSKEDTKATKTILELSKGVVVVAS